MVEREPLTVGRPGVRIQPSGHVRKLSLMKMPAGAENVGNPPFEGHAFHSVGKSTRKRKPGKAVDVGEAPRRRQSSFCIKEFLPEGKLIRVKRPRVSRAATGWRILISVGNVGNLSTGSRPSCFIRELTLRRHPTAAPSARRRSRGCQPLSCT